jgi:hypothetical protein
MIRLRMGANAGSSCGRIEATIALANRVNLDFPVFECLAEPTIALAQQA